MTDQIFTTQPQAGIATGVEIPQAAENVTRTVDPQQEQIPGVVSQPPVKRKFPMTVVLIVLGVVLLGVVIFFVVNKIRKIPGKSGEITWWGLWEEESAISPLISEYEQLNPGIKIKYVKQSKQDYRERLTNALAKGGGPDIFRFHNSWVPMFRDELSPVPASAMGPAEFAQVYYPVVSADLTSGTGIVGIPLEYDALTLFINEDIFSAAGKSPPTTWDDLRNLAIELTKKDDKGNITQSGVALGRTENVDHWQEILGLMMLQNGVDLSKPVGKLAEDALNFFTIFSKNDGVWNETLPSSTQYFAGGKLAMYFAPSWRVFEITNQNPNLKFKTVSLPQLPKQGPDQKDVAYATYWVEGVWSKSKNKEIAWDFLKFISSKESLSKLYTNAAGQRSFGPPYPRTDMAPLLSDHEILGSIVAKAPFAQSWYLQSRTFDGPTGINSLISKYFEDAVNSVNAGSSADEVLQTVAQGVSQVLGQYGYQ